MCGRYASFRQAQELADVFDVEVVSEDAAAAEPSWNVAPTDGVRVVLPRTSEATGGVEDAGSEEGRDEAAGEDPEPASGRAGSPAGLVLPVREMHLARWGLVPHWAKDPSVGARMINARSETLAEKPAFARSLRTRRCILPAEGYYEWQKDPDAGPRAPKTPYFIHDPDGAPLAFAGLYAWWRDPRGGPDGEPAPWLLSCTIVTTSAVGPMNVLHDRVPVVLGAEALERWLDPSVSDADELMDVLRAPGPQTRWYEVSRLVSSVRNDGPQLIDPVG